MYRNTDPDLRFHTSRDLGERWRISADFRFGLGMGLGTEPKFNRYDRFNTYSDPLP